MPSQTPNSSVVPAQLSYLTIYNPSFGNTDETAYEQILYYCSKKELEKQYQKGVKLSQHDGAAESKADAAPSEEEERNERLRRVGLARGMVEFANTFSNGRPVDSIETEKSRVVLQELEPGWWILASVDLTRLPTAAKQSRDEDEDKNGAVEYSSREVSPPQLLLKQLEQAHALFMLHHTSSLNELYERVGRDLFCGILEKYWNRFVWDWDVLLHANPAVTIYNATKLAGGGELGIGVGEEEWGSGEREVLEDFVQRTEGLVDVVVGRYGDAPPDVNKNGKGDVESQPEPWLGAEDYPQASDGIIFSGVGALSKRSLTTVSQWMEAIFRHGDNAYGVGDNPTSRPRQRRKRRRRAANGDAGTGTEPTADAPARVKSPRGSRQPDLRRRAMENNAPPGIPPPLIGTVERSLDQAVASAQRKEGSQSQKSENDQTEPSIFDPEKMMGYLKLGYGSSWTLNPKGFQSKEDEAEAKLASDEAPTDQQEQAEPPSMQELDPTPDISDDEEEPPFVQRLEQSIGKFLIGLSGDLENTEFEDDQIDTSITHPSSKTQRLFLRTLTLQLSHFYQSEHPSTPTKDPTSTKLRVVIYIHQPFIFTFLFTLQTAQLSIPSFYRSIHHQLGPLQKPLLRSTDPTRISERIAQHVTISSGGMHAEDIEALGLRDLIYDPVKLTVRTSIPNIPIPGTLAAEGMEQSRTVSGAWYTLGIPISSTPNTASTRSPSASLAGATTSTSTHRTPAASSNTATTAANPGPSPTTTTNPRKSVWTRVQALHIHTQILATYISTRPSQTAFLHAGNDDFERTVRSSRGWWVVWMRVSRNLGDGHGEANARGGFRDVLGAVSGGTGTGNGTSAAAASSNAGSGGGGGGEAGPSFSHRILHRSEGSTPRLRRDETDETEYADAFGGQGKEAFLVRKSVDFEGPRGSRFGEAGAGGGSASASARRWLSMGQRDASGSAASVGEGGRDGGGGTGAVGARELGEGVGVDARKWIEGVGRMS